MNTPGKYIGRFAPSPTGPLHFGSLVAALASYLDAKAHGGAWRVRMEDVDETRCSPEHAEDILRTLVAFGLNWDGEVMIQSQRRRAYAQALVRLAKASLVYPCTCSRKEIADSAMGIEGPIYPGTCRAFANTCSAATACTGQRLDKTAAVRVITNDEPIAFHDRVQGTIVQRIAFEVGDFVLKRRDGLFAYQLAVVIDDAEQGITDVVRGADLLDSTARQIYLQKLWGFTTPQYLHVPIVINETGQKLSKQTLAPGLGQTDVVAILQAALAFLGQRAMSTNLSPAAVLASAVGHWREANIPKSRAARASSNV